MQATTKAIGVIFLGCLLCVFLGVAVGGEDYVSVAAVTLPLLLVGAKLALGSTVRIEAFLLTGLICGYIIGGKGFAYVGVGNSLFMGEVMFVFIGLCWLTRTVLTRERLFGDRALTVVILLFVAYSGLHLLGDFRAFGLLAIRDSALAYYSLFFFFALSIANHRESVEFLQKWVVRAILILCFIVQPINAMVDLSDRLLVRGVPLIYHNSDTLASNFLIGSILLFFQARSTVFPLFKLPLYGLSLVCLAYLLYLARSTYLVSATLLIVFLCLAGQRRFAVTAIAGGGALLLMVLSGVSLGLLDGQKLNLDFLQEKGDGAAQSA